MTSIQTHDAFRLETSRRLPTSVSHDSADLRTAKVAALGAQVDRDEIPRALLTVKQAVVGIFGSS